jgi:hypothetical protein
MTFIEAAAEVLRQAGKPLHYKEITELAIAQNLLSHVGKTPEVTMSHRLTSAVKKDDKDVPIVKVKPGIFALREWDGKKPRKAAAAAPQAEKDEEKEEGASDDEGLVVDDADAEDEGLEVNALEIEAALSGGTGGEQEKDHVAGRHGRHDGEEDDEEEGPSEGTTPVSGDEALRADLAASGAELFDDEEDDDQPILAPLSQPGSAPAGQPGEGGRRRRRRRRRGRGGGQGEAASGFPQAGGEGRFGARPGEASQPRLDRAAPEGGAIQPSPIVSIEGEGNGGEAREVYGSRPVVRDRQQIMAGGQPTGIDIPLGEGDELAGRDLADAAAIVLASFDRNAGPVQVRAVADALLRRGRLQGDPVVATAQASASMRADNLRRSASGQRPRFRFSNGTRVALTEWMLGGDVVRLEQEVVAAVDRYREASRRALLRKIQELPGHALIELVVLALERAGMANVKTVRRSGSPGGEAHFSAVHKTGSDSIPTAIVIRKDGREIGRERVTDLRGALHHYGPANAGWLVTTGQCLSGAREEASAPGAPPVALYDGLSLAKLLEELDVGVVKTRFSVAIPDLEFLETLRG